MIDKKTKILIIEDEEVVARYIANILDKLDYIVVGLESDGNSAIKVMNKINPDIILMDIYLNGDMDGIDTAKKINEKWNIPIIYITISTNNIIFERVKRTNNYGFLIKPIKEKELYLAIELALYKHNIDLKLRNKNEELYKSKSRYKAIVEDLTDFVVRYKLDGSLTFVNKAFCMFYGKTEEELMSGKIYDTIFKDDLIMVKNKIVKINYKNQVVKLEHRVKLPNKEIRWLRSTIRGIFGKNNEIIEYQFVATDITEKKETEKVLIENEKKYRHLFEETNDAIFLIDLNEKHFDANKKAVEMFGYEYDELIKLPVSKLVKPDEYPESQKKLKELLKKGTLKIYERNFIDKNNNIIPCEINVSVVYDSENKPLYIQSMVRNIIERKNTEKILHKIIMKLKNSNDELEQFTSVVAHDLKNPLSVIISALEVVRDKYYQPLQKKAKNVITIAIKRGYGMSKMIDEFLSYARMENNIFKENDCNYLVQEAISNLFLEIKKSGAEITKNELPKIFCNEIQIISLFKNLIENGIKYCDKEKPKIHISVKEKENEWLFSVEDNGIGINSKNYREIFKIFRRIAPNESKYDGTGIGLSYCKKIVKKHSGKIWVESEIGRGSIFYFTIQKK